MAKIDVEYNKILRKILDNGVNKGDRTGTGTRSIFSHTLEHDMSDGFPLLTTKKMFTKGITTELLWFLNGDTNLRSLVEQGNNIWVGDAHKKYLKENVAISLESEASTLLEGHVKNGRKREDFIDLIKTSDEFSEQWGNLGPIYGKQWVKWDSIEREMIKTSEHKEYGPLYQMKPKGINQIQNAIDLLNDNPDSRRIMVSAWNPTDIPQMILPPCHWAFELYTEELSKVERIVWVISNNDVQSKYETEDLDRLNVPKRKLSLKWHQRSVDVPLGLPFNIASYGFLLEMFAQQTNMVAGTLIGDLTNVHIYQNQLGGVREQLGRSVTEYGTPKLNLNKADDIFSYKVEDFTIEGYESFPTIKYPLSN
jgi:thymidylate synthase